LQLQHSFQVVLSTDGLSSFAFFIYEDPGIVNYISPHQVGFNAGDRVGGINIVGSRSAAYTGNLAQVNIYSIDGNNDDPCTCLRPSYNAESSYFMLKI